MKHEWRKHERELYSVKEKPSIITVPPQKFIMIKGEGNPNNEDFSQRVGVLYSIAYPIKMRFKDFCNNNTDESESFDFQDFAVYPLEGIWSTSNPDDSLDKDSFSYIIMIRQPKCITEEMFKSAYETVQKKKPHPLLKEVFFKTMEDGKCIHMLHKGSFDNEDETFAVMDAFAKDNNLIRLNNFHREIYLNDARKTVPEKRKTILRFQVKNI